MYGQPNDPKIFARVRDGRQAKIRHVDVDLSSARSLSAYTALELPISGDSFYIDANPLDGVATVYFQADVADSAEVPLYCAPGMIFNMPFTKLRIANAAQSGKKIRIVYGVGVDFQPGSVAQVSITGTLNAPTYTATQSRVNVAAASTQIVPANASRKYLKLINNSAAAVTLNEQGGAAVASQGQVLASGGGWFEWNANVPINAITGISASGTVALDVVEGN